MKMPKIKIIDTFVDDCLPCVKLKINKRVMTLWWCSEYTVGALEYMDSPKAQKKFAKLIKILKDPESEWRKESGDERYEDKDKRGVNTSYGWLEWGYYPHES